jgi:hypothetical protein
MCYMWDMAVWAYCGKNGTGECGKNGTGVPAYLGLRIGWRAPPPAELAFLIRPSSTMYR